LHEHGSFEAEAVKFFEGRKSLVRDSRQLIKGAFDSRPDSKAYLNGPWDFHVTAEKAMQSRNWLER
jgi:hypothetical protein